MTIDGNKYAGFELDTISLDGLVLRIGIGRFTLPAGTVVELVTEPMQARLIFLGRKNIVFSNVRRGTPISGIEQTDDGEGGTCWTVRFSPESFIQVSAREVAEFRF